MNIYETEEFRKGEYAAGVYISGEDLEGLSLRLNTDYEEDWFNIFYRTEKNMSLNLKEDDIQRNTVIRLDFELAQKIAETYKLYDEDKLKKDYKRVQLINNLSYERKILISREVKIMILEGKLDNLTVDEIETLLS